MSDPEESDALLLRLRLLAASRPREAREFFARLMDDNGDELTQILSRLSGPGEGRLRQIVANTVRAEPRRAAVVPQLREWLTVEADEFTKNAIRGALDATRVSERTVGSKDISPLDPKFVEAYRYASSRLMHRVRNSLEESQAALMLLDRSITDLRGDEFHSSVVQIAADLASGFLALARVVEFEQEDRYFELRSVVLCDWLQMMNADYAGKYAPVALRWDVLGDDRSVRVRGSDYLLGTIFWNLWKNAQQALGESCAITLRVRKEGSVVQVLVLDSGDGFPLEAREMVFSERFSSRGRSRGRGLLEVQDAVERLHGRIVLVTEQEKLRVRISFPLEVQ
jgi:signal transduction histidine kinase